MECILIIVPEIFVIACERVKGNKLMNDGG